MDTFFEQIVPIRKSGKTWATFVGIWLLTGIICYFLLMFSFGTMFGSLLLIGMVGIIFGAYKLSSRLMVEYEYIITNGEFDIDKIVAKNSRKRIFSFELSDVERVEKYNPNAKPVGNYKNTIIACNEDDANAYFLVLSKEGKGSSLIVMAPDDRLKSAMIKFLPKFISNSAFK